MLQDFDFKIMHRLKSKHMNVDVLNCNLMGDSNEDEDPKPKVPKKHETIQELTNIVFIDGVGGEMTRSQVTG